MTGRARETFDQVDAVDGSRGRKKCGVAPLAHVHPGRLLALGALFLGAALAVALGDHLVCDVLGQAQLDQGLDLVGHDLVARRLDGGDDVVDVDRGSLHHVQAPVYHWTVDPNPGRDHGTGAGRGTRRGAGRPAYLEVDGLPPQHGRRTAFDARCRRGRTHRGPLLLRPCTAPRPATRPPPGPLRTGAGRRPGA